MNFKKEIASLLPWAAVALVYTGFVVFHARELEQASNSFKLIVLGVGLAIMYFVDK